MSAYCAVCVVCAVLQRIISQTRRHLLPHLNSDMICTDSTVYICAYYIEGIYKFVMYDGRYILIYWNTLIKSDATCANEIWLGEYST